MHHEDAKHLQCRRICCIDKMDKAIRNYSINEDKLTVAGTEPVGFNELIRCKMPVTTVR
jgi:hypothetical protein